MAVEGRRPSAIAGPSSMALAKALPLLLKVSLKFAFLDFLLITLQMDSTTPEDVGFGLLFLAERSVGILGYEEMNGA